ncbi:MAG: hypothetical protein ABIJ95_02955, partial [Pseudomonadota bacterium]
MSLQSKTSSPGEDVESIPKIGVFVCHCGANIGKVVDCPKVAEAALGLPGVVVSKDIGYACSEPGQQEIKDLIEEYGLERVVVASCS